MAWVRVNRAAWGSLRNRPGVTLAELLVVLTLTGVLGTITMTTIIGAQRHVRQHIDRVAGAEARRVTASVLAAELRYLDPTTDIYGRAVDSVALRAYRGVAIVCVGDLGTVLVRYRGLRAPEPAKDSVVMVGGWAEVAGGQGGGAVHAGLVSPIVASGEVRSGCDIRAGESLYRWTLNDVTPPGTLLLVFERGSYHLQDGALRYRRGDAGRQPLTAELLDDRVAALQWAATGGVGSDGSSPGADPLAGVAIVLATRPTPAGTAPLPRGTRNWIRLPNGGLW